MVIFEHQSDYSVLLNPQSIESWWRSLIVFKIHARLSNSSSSSSLSSKTVQSSSLVGVARLSLRNVLKSRNLKLAKRLAVKDPNETTKRVGTLHVSLELTSDSREFMAGLLKLKSTESSNGGVNRRRSRSPAAPNRTASPSPTPAFLPPPLLSTTNSIKQHQQLPFAHLPTFPQQQQQQQQINTIKRPTTTTTTTNNNPIKPTPSTTQLQPPKQEDTNETGIPIHMYLSINESRLNHQQTSNIYLICRLFWNKEKIRFESDEKQQKQSANKSLCWTLNLSFVLRNSIVENMKNNFMIIEAWGRRGGEETLVGTIKLPLHEFWVKLTSKSTDERRLMVAEDSLLYQLPLIGVDGWISAFDPFTGDKAGEINALLALGSNKQIMNLQKVLFDKARSNVNSGGGDFLNPLNTKPSLMEHIFTICVENINWSRLGAGKWQSNDDQEEMYIKYTFPSSMHRSNESSTWENNRTTYIIPLKASPSQNRMEHRLVLSSTQSIHSHLIETLSSSSGVRFELWCKSVYPNRRERLLARAILPVERLLGTLTATFPVPLIDEAVSTTTTIGELNVAVNYRCEELAYNLLPPDSSKFLLPPQFTRPDDDQAAVTLNVGVLRVYGLEKAASDLIKRGASLNRLVSLENSNLYVKFALAFLNRPQEVKQTRLESSMLTGYSPEYFAYFDVKCPLQSTYNSATRRTVSLAEQIELGHLTFEVWNKFVDPNSEKNSYESLLGTCVVQLDALLDNRIGIRGWLPIRPLVGNHLLASLIDDQSSIGGLEIAIRFCKADDYLKVLDAAKQIGWTRSNDPPRSIQSVEFTSSRNIAPISPPPSQPPKQQPLTTTTKIESNSGDRRRVKCLVEIERAVHLASVYEASTSRHQAPNAFVSFQATASENSSASANSSIETNVCARQTSPFWNYQLVVHISVDYFVYEAKYFVLKVLHSNDESRVSGDKLLGNVSIDLQPLICGLSHISGWYNIQDTAGNNQGQLKVSILPQENLVWLKDLYTKRRRQQQQSMVGASERMTSFCMAPLPPTSNNTTSNKYSDLSINQATTTSNSSLENTTSANNTSNSMSAPPATTSTPVGDLKAGLQQKLDELDRLNRSLKERLDRSKSTSINNSNNKSKSNNSESSITNRSSEEEMRIQRPPQPQQIPISYHHRHHHNEDSTPFKPSNTGGGGGGGNTNHQSSVLLDSFWMSSINSDKAAAPSAVAASTAASIHINILETVKQSSGSDVNGEQNDDDDDGNEQQQELYHFNHHQPQQQERDEEEEETNTNRVKNRATTTVTLSEPRNIFEPSESSQDSKKKITNNNNNNNEDDEKTELDQTFNLNTSFEIVEQHYERKNSEQQNDDDEINRIIDCSKLEMNDDEEPAALNREETREVSLFIPSNVKVIKTYENDENEEETNGRNFTVVIPEELNKIDQDESNPGDLESKLPNYFLPRDDMEKSMKRLHFNYKTIDKIKKLDEENGNEEENDDDEEDTKQQHSVKHKSVALLIQNQNSIKKDLNRINKIFHSKFS